MFSISRLSGRALLSVVLAAVLVSCMLPEPAPGDRRILAGLSALSGETAALFDAFDALPPRAYADRAERYEAIAALAETLRRQSARRLGRAAVPATGGVAMPRPRTQGYADAIGGFMADFRRTLETLRHADMATPGVPAADRIARSRLLLQDILRDAATYETRGQVRRF